MFSTHDDDTIWWSEQCYQKCLFTNSDFFFLSGLDATHPAWCFFFFSNKAITPTFQNPPHPCMHTGRRKQNKTKQKKTDLVEALHHHVRHVLIKHGGWYDDLVKGFVVAPQSWIGRLLLAAATEAAQRESERERAREKKSVSRADDGAATHTDTVRLPR